MAVADPAPSPLDALWGPLRGLLSLGRPGGAGGGGGGVAAAAWDRPDRAGWLHKQGEHLPTWRRRWFVLQGGRLFWFLSPADAASGARPRGSLDVGTAVCVKNADDVLADSRDLAGRAARARALRAAAAEAAAAADAARASCAAAAAADEAQRELDATAAAATAADAAAAAACDVAFAFEVTTRAATHYLIAGSERDKEEWINGVGRAIVQRSSSACDDL